MAVFGPFKNIHSQLLADPRFAAAFDYGLELLQAGSALHRRIGALPAGSSAKHPLAGGAVAIEQVYLTKPRPEGFFESHRQYIDVQLVVEGEEVMEVEDISRLQVAEAYDGERDLLKYADTAAASVLRLRPGDVAVFFPADGHMPTLQVDGAALVRKSVIKVPVAL